MIASAVAIIIVSDRFKEVRKFTADKNFLPRLLCIYQNKESRGRSQYTRVLSISTTSTLEILRRRRRCSESKRLKFRKDKLTLVILEKCDEVPLTRG